LALFERRFGHLTGAKTNDADDDKTRTPRNQKPHPIEEFQAHGLAVLAAPQIMRSFRLLYRPKPLAEVSNRFHLTPLIRAMTSAHDLFVQALTERAARARLLAAHADPYSSSTQRR
jgi:hypothetical protein